MTVPQGWADLVRKTWLGDHALRKRLDDLVRRWLGNRRGLPPAQRASVAALTVDRAYTEIQVLQPRWFACTTLIVLSGELVVGAPKGKILSNAVDDWDRETDEEAWIDVMAMNLLRNCVCHPADQPIPALCSHIEAVERDFVTLAKDLKADWSRLGEREVAEYGLRKLDAVGRHVLRRYANH